MWFKTLLIFSVFITCLCIKISLAEKTNIGKNVEENRHLYVLKDIEFSNNFQIGIQNASDCDCGENAISCSKLNGVKICKCKPGYAPADYQICTAMCNKTAVCNNSGNCFNDICLCPPGTSGPFCGTIDDCSELKCENDENAVCSYDTINHRAYCKCKQWDHVFDYDVNKCKECKCDKCKQEVCLSDSRKCEFIRGEKKCTCSLPRSKLNPKTNICEWCFCSGNFKKCDFDDEGNTVCKCEYGYSQKGSSCERCDCGSNTVSCEFKNYKRVCSCFDGYSEWNGYCQKCDCGKNGKCEFDRYQIKTRCICNPGFIEISGVCQEETSCHCGNNGVCKIEEKGKVCICPEGFQNVNGLCTDINECDDPKTCSNEMKCINSIGNYSCVCRDGFQPYNDQSEGCEDINECLNTSTCADSNIECLNTIGSYKCICKSGYSTRVDNLSPVYCESQSKWKLYYGLLMALYFVSMAGILFFIYKKYRSTLR